jgi:hypothetical protein
MAHWSTMRYDDPTARRPSRTPLSCPVGGPLLSNTSLGVDIIPAGRKISSSPPIRGRTREGN